MLFSFKSNKKIHIQVRSNDLKDTIFHNLLKTFHLAAKMCLDKSVSLPGAGKKKNLIKGETCPMAGMLRRSLLYTTLQVMLSNAR